LCKRNANELPDVHVYGRGNVHVYGRRHRRRAAVAEPVCAAFAALQPVCVVLPPIEDLASVFLNCFFVLFSLYQDSDAQT